MTPYQTHLAAALRRRKRVIKLWKETKLTKVEIARKCEVTPPRVHKIVKDEGLIDYREKNNA